jgi:hypothetical protein
VRTTTTLPLAVRQGRFTILGARGGISGADRAWFCRMGYIARRSATLSPCAPGRLLPTLCHRRPACLRLGAAFGVFHVSFPSHRARP